MQKVLWFDTETTGLKPVRHGIVQVACIVEINGEAVERRNFLMNPLVIPGKEFEPDTAKVHDMTEEEIRKLPPAPEVKKEIKDFLTKYVDPYNRFDKFTPAGFNVGFDIDFMFSLWKDCGDEFFFSLVGGGGDIDPHKTLGLLEWAKLIPRLEKRDLTSVCNFFGISIPQAHNAVDDIEATRKLAITLKKILSSGGMPL